MWPQGNTLELLLPESWVMASLVRSPDVLPRGVCLQPGHRGESASSHSRESKHLSYCHSKQNLHHIRETNAAGKRRPQSKSIQAGEAQSCSLRPKFFKEAASFWQTVQKNKYILRNQLIKIERKPAFKDRKISYQKWGKEIQCKNQTGHKEENPDWKIMFFSEKKWR